MNHFRFVNSESPAQAATMLAEEDGGARFVAGGTDLMGEIKEGIVSPSTLVALNGDVSMHNLAVSPEGVRIGALVTVAELESYPEIAQKYPALAQAAASVATPQIRNVGTVGGNLCQRPRCWFYRSPLFDCLKKGGSECFAYEDNNKYHAIFGGAGCYIVHPSDLAVALIALRANVSILGSDGMKTMALEDFFVAPDQNMASENVLKPGEILTELALPPTVSDHRSIYLKAKERSAMDFALSSVALSADVSDGIVGDARVVLGGVAPVPWRVPHVENALNGKLLGQIDAADIGRLAVRDAQPLKDNGYKVRLTQGLVSKAVRNLFGST